MTSSPRQNARRCLDAARDGKREEWNKWVKENPNVDINFSGMDLHQYRNENGILDFSVFHFPNGNISFFGANFGEGDVLFENVEFSKGSVSFERSEFGKGNVSFNNSCFNTDTITFEETKFDDGNVSFSGSKFYSKLIRFTGYTFGKGYIAFEGCYFAKGLLDFTPSDLSQCTKIGFVGSIMECTITFGTISSPCIISFIRSKVDGKIEFDGTDIGYAPDPKNPYTSAAFRCLKKFAKNNEDREREIDFFAKEIRYSYYHDLKDKLFTCWAYKAYDFFSDFGRSFSRPFICLILNMIIFSCIYKIQQMDSLGIYFYTISFLLFLTLLYIFITTRLKDITLLFGLVVSIIFAGHYLNIPSMFSSRTFALSATYSLPFYSASITGRKALEDMILPFSGCDEKQKEYYRPKRKRLAITGILQGIISGVFLFLIALALRNRFRS